MPMLCDSPKQSGLKQWNHEPAEEQSEVTETKGI